MEITLKRLRAGRYTHTDSVTGVLHVVSRTAVGWRVRCNRVYFHRRTLQDVRALILRRLHKKQKDHTAMLTDMITTMNPTPQQIQHATLEALRISGSMPIDTKQGVVKCVFPNKTPYTYAALAHTDDNLYNCTMHIKGVWMPHLTWRGNLKQCKQWAAVWSLRLEGKISSKLTAELHQRIKTNTLTNKSLFDVPV